MIQFWQFTDHQSYKIAIHHHGKYEKYLASLPNEILFQSPLFFSNRLILGHKICYKLMTHCLLDALLCEFYYDSASSRLMDSNKLEYGINLFISVIYNYPCVQLITTFCRELPHRYANNIFEQLKPYSLKRLRIRKQLNMLHQMLNILQNVIRMDVISINDHTQRKEILGSMFDGLAVVSDKNIVFVDNDDIKTGPG